MHFRNNSLASSCHRHIPMHRAEAKSVYVKQVLFERAPPLPSPWCILEDAFLMSLSALCPHPLTEGF